MDAATMLRIAVSEVRLLAGLGPRDDGEGVDAAALVFTGVVAGPADPADDPAGPAAALAGRTMTIRCLPGRGDGDVLGWCQDCPLAGSLGLEAEIRCCRKRIGALRNALSFGQGDPRRALTVNLELAAAEGRGDSGLVRRYPVRRLSLGLALPFAADPSPAGPAAVAATARVAAQ